MPFHTLGLWSVLVCFVIIRVQDLQRSFDHKPMGRQPGPILCILASVCSHPENLLDNAGGGLLRSQGRLSRRWSARLMRLAGDLRIEVRSVDLDLRVN